MRRAACGCLAAALLAGGCGASPLVAHVGGFEVRVAPDPARVTIVDGSGRVLLDGLPRSIAFRTAQPDYKELFGSFLIDETAPAWRAVTTLSKLAVKDGVVTFVLDGQSGGGGTIRSIGDGALEIVLRSPTANRATAQFACAPSEQFLGFGAQPKDTDERGQTVPLFVAEHGIGRTDTNEPLGDWFFEGTRHQTYFPLPFFVSSRGYGVEARTSYRSLFAMCSESASAWRVEAWEGTLALHLYAGPQPLDVIRRHSDDVGRPPVPPDFAFAPWNDAIFGAGNVRRIAQELRDSHIPSSVIWTEDWGGGVASGDDYNINYTGVVDRTLYPDLEAMAGELHAAGFKFLGYFNTFVPTDAPSYAAATSGGFLIKRPDGTPNLLERAGQSYVGMVDLTSDAAKTWLGGILSRAIDLGFDGWMADYGEWMPVTGVQLASGEDPEAVHNRYPVLWQELNEQILAARSDGVERLTFVRSGYTGSQAIGGQVVWGGDQTTDFDPGGGLPTVIPLALGLGVSGMPCFGSDIGGYTSTPSHPPTTKELFFRWTTLGAASPIMRTHHGFAAKVNWHFDSDAETLAHYGRWARFHIRLYPYLHAAALEASQTGAPMLRALALGFPDDAAAWPLLDQFLLGPSLLVAPVVAPGQTTRRVHLPPARWFPVVAPAAPAAPGATAVPAIPIDGPVDVDVDAPLTELPIFARAGAVLVLLPGTVETLTRAAGIDLASVGDAREVIAFLGAAGQFSEGSLAYQLTSTTSAPGQAATLAFAGAPLPACAGATPQANCGAIDLAAREAIAQVRGDGSLQLLDGAAVVAELATSGGAAGRMLTLHLRW